MILEVFFNLNNSVILCSTLMDTVHSPPFFFPDAGTKAGTCGGGRHTLADPAMAGFVGAVVAFPFHLL